MHRCSIFTALTILGTLAGGIAHVRAGTHATCACQAQCPRCQHVCRLSIEPEQQSKECFEVECKPICIPAITWPWQSCGEPKHARLVYVRSLKVKQYECERCTYRWTPEPCAACAAQPSCSTSYEVVGHPPLSLQPIVSPNTWPPAGTAPMEDHNAAPRGGLAHPQTVPQAEPARQHVLWKLLPQWASQRLPQ